jgi:phosphoglycerate dehydrogenase-like enzyme
MQRRPLVVYTDPAWALTPAGTSDPSRATLEREIFADAVRLEIAPARNGRYPALPELAELTRGADALAIYRTAVTPELLDAVGDSLAVVARQGVGFDNLAPDLLRARGIIGFNVPDYCVDEVAAHTLALILALERGVIAQHRTLTGGRFDIYAGGVPRRLSRASAGIVGFGRIGRAVAARLRLFYGRVRAADPYVDADLMIAHGVEKCEPAELLAQSDVVTLHCTLDAGTAGLIGADALARMKPTAFLVNAARGGLVDAGALYRALAGGALAGAALDVFVPEDPTLDETYRAVLRLPNVIVTSHRAFLSAEAEASQRRRVAHGIMRALADGLPPDAGNLTGAVRVEPRLSERPLAGAR